MADLKYKSTVKYGKVRYFKQLKVAQSSSKYFKVLQSSMKYLQVLQVNLKLKSTSKYTTWSSLK
jgi:hypothetical protein